MVASLVEHPVVESLPNLAQSLPSPEYLSTSDIASLLLVATPDIAAIALNYLEKALADGVIRWKDLLGETAAEYSIVRMLNTLGERKEFKLFEDQLARIFRYGEEMYTTDAIVFPQAEG